jgi:hypothetical protein
MFRVQPGGELEAVKMGATDEEGVFIIEIPGPGVYRVQADLNGLSTPLSREVDFASGVAGAEENGEVVLMLPSTLLQSALTCSVEAGEGAAAVVGVVRDPETEVPFPGARVVATWREGGMAHRIETETDGAGRYRLCPPAGAGKVEFQTYLMGRWERHGDVEIPGLALVIQDLEVTLPSSTRTSSDVIQQRILQEAAARTLGDLRGEILDRENDVPLRYAVVRLQGTAHQTVSDADGRFVLSDLNPDIYTLEIRSLGYEVVTEPIEVPAGQDVFLGLRVAPQAVEVEGLVVTARASAEQTLRMTPFQRSIAYGEIMAREEERGAWTYEALRRAAPGVRITERYTEASGTILCIETNRRVQSFSGGCANAQVVVDGMRMPPDEGPRFLRDTPVSEIESIEFISPVHAQILYGIGGDTANGVVVVYTRGKGPYASPLRNR